MFRTRAGFIAAAVAAMLTLAATALAASRITFEDTLKSGESSSVSVTVHRSAAFRVSLTAPTAGRTRLYLTGATAPTGGPLMDTKASGACEGTAGTFHCTGSYEPLPKGSYKFRVKFTGAASGHVKLSVRW
jgi:hypothetical protein